MDKAHESNLTWWRILDAESRKPMTKKTFRKKLTNPLVCLLLILVSSLLLSNIPVEAQDVEGEVQTGPEFKDDDATKAENCTMTTLAQKFPFDLVSGNINSSGWSCPNIKLFGSDNQLGWILDIWRQIEPAFITSLFVYGLFNWELAKDFNNGKFHRTKNPSFQGPRNQFHAKPLRAIPKPITNPDDQNSLPRRL